MQGQDLPERNVPAVGKPEGTRLLEEATALICTRSGLKVLTKPLPSLSQHCLHVTYQGL